MIKNLGFVHRPGVWWDADEWLGSHRPRPGGVLDPEEWHSTFMRGAYMGAIYGPVYRGHMGWVTRLRTSLKNIEYWAYVPNNDKDPMEWYTVHSTGLVRRSPTKSLQLGVSGLFDVLPMNGSDVLMAAMVERAMAIPVGVWAWWLPQVMPNRMWLLHSMWLSRWAPDARVPVAAIREGVQEVARKMRAGGNNYARYAAKFEKALQGLRKKHPEHFYEIA